MKLEDLPQFSIAVIHATSDGAFLHGTVVAPGPLKPGRFWLYAGARSVIGNLSLQTSDTPASFEAPFWTPDSPAQVGTTFPLIDGYWQADLVMRVLDPNAGWALTNFQSSPAQYFRLGKTTGSQPLGGPLPSGAVPLHVDPTGWDHEHCEIWGEKVGTGGAPSGYHDGNGHWLCESCFTKYAASQSLAFLGAS